MIDIKEFQGYLAIDKHALDDELIQHPTLLDKVSEAMVEATAKRDAAKDNLAIVEAELDAKIREDHDKITEPQVKSLITANRDRGRASSRYLMAKADADRLSALKDAFIQRGYMLRDLVHLHVSNYFQESSVRSDAAQDQAVYDRRRARMAEARKSRGE